MNNLKDAGITNVVAYFPCGLSGRYRDILDRSRDNTKASGSRVIVTINGLIAVVSDTGKIVEQTEIPFDSIEEYKKGRYELTRPNGITQFAYRLIGEKTKPEKTAMDELKSMTKKELLEQAHKKGLEGFSKKTTKVELIELLSA